MNRDCPLIVSDEYLYKRVFIYDTSKADCRYFRQRIVDFLKAPQSKTFSQFMFEAVWERNEQGRTLKYCYFDECNQKVKLDNYFYEWMKRTIHKAEVELRQYNSEQNPEGSVATNPDSSNGPDKIPDNK